MARDDQTALSRPRLIAGAVMFGLGVLLVIVSVVDRSFEVEPTVFGLVLGTGLTLWGIEAVVSKINGKS